MGVVTTSDKMREEAKEHLTLAQNLLFDAAKSDNQWAEPYNSKFIDTLYDCSTKIRKIIRKI